jgi:NADP-dependent 3-hydroxy acid dehydrogenase YdfG
MSGGPPSEKIDVKVGATIRTPVISPGAIDSELKMGSGDKASRDFVLDFYKRAIPASAIACAVAYAIEQPADVDVNEIVIRPTAQDF